MFSTLQDYFEHVVIYMIEVHFYSTDGLSVGVLTVLNKFNEYLNKQK